MSKLDKQREEAPLVPHEWDGVEEFDNPIPKFWTYTLLITIAWAIVIWVLYPAWPIFGEGEYTKGILGYDSRENVHIEVAEAKAAQATYVNQINTLSIDDIKANDDLRRFANQAGKSAFAVNCSQCHGLYAAGGPGYPNLLDDEWIWGGTVDEIAYTIRHGIRNDQDEQAHFNAMPAFGFDGILNRGQVNDVAEFVLSFTNRSGDADAALRGQELYANNCASCHGVGGEGDTAQGAPALNNQIWLYGGSKSEIVETVWFSRNGVMPAWGGRLDEATIKQMAIYVHDLGGGQ